MRFFFALFIIIFLATAAFHCKEAEVIDPRDQLVGSYDMAQICNDQAGDSLRYQVVVSKSPEFNDRVIVDNFGGYGQGNFLLVTVASDQSLSIPSQEIAVGLLGKATIDGSGQWNDDVLFFDSRVFISGIVDTQCKSQGSKL